MEDEATALRGEALLIIHTVHSSATPEGVDKAAADKEARWGVKGRGH